MPTIEVLPTTSTSGPNWTYTTLPPSQSHSNNPLLTTSLAAAASSSKNTKLTRSNVKSRLQSIPAGGYSELDETDFFDSVSVNAGATSLTSRKDEKLVKRLLEYERDNSRDVAIPIPKKSTIATASAITKAAPAASNSRSSRSSAAKSSTPVPPTSLHTGLTTNTRKILSSQKTFANHLSDEDALLATHLTNPSINFQNLNPHNIPTSLRATRRTPIASALEEIGGVQLAYREARAEESRKPRRWFCEICGYWGKYVCIKCGGVRVCSAACKEVHEESRCQRFWV